MGTADGKSGRFIFIPRLPRAPFNTDLPLISSVPSLPAAPITHLFSLSTPPWGPSRAPGGGLHFASSSFSFSGCPTMDSSVLFPKFEPILYLTPSHIHVVLYENISPPGYIANVSLKNLCGRSSAIFTLWLCPLKAPAADPEGPGPPFESRIRALRVHRAPGESPPSCPRSRRQRHWAGSGSGGSLGLRSRLGQGADMAW